MTGVPGEERRHGRRESRTIRTLIGTPGNGGIRLPDTHVATTVVTVRSNRAEGRMLAVAARRLAGEVRAHEEAVLTRLVADTGETRPADVGFAQPALLHWRTDGGTDRGSLAEIKFRPTTSLR